MGFDEQERLRPVVAGGFAADRGNMVSHPLWEIESRADIKGARNKSQDVNGGSALGEVRGYFARLFHEVHVGRVEERRKNIRDFLDEPFDALRLLRAIRRGCAILMARLAEPKTVATLKEPL
jgi:hypothetical protein